MADPITIAAGVGMAGTAVGGIIGGLGAKESADANAAAYRYKSGVALLNKQINDKNAEFSLESGGIKGMEKGLAAGQEIGETKVRQAASGLDVNSGSALAVRNTQSKVAQFDQDVIEWDSEKTAYGYHTRAATDVAESNLDLLAASQSETAGTIGEITSFINAGTSVASKWSQAKSTGIM